MKLNAFGYDRLAVFRRAFETGGVKAAAEKAHLTASAVSQSLAKLEEGLGAPLFVRAGRRLLPTAAAKALYERSSRFLAGLAEDFPDESDTGVLRGEVRIAAPPLFGAGPLLDAFAGFRAAQPGVRLTLVLMSSNRILEELRAGRIDYGVIDDFPELHRGGDVALEPLAREELVLCGHRDLVPRELRRKPAAWGDLAGLPLIPYHDGFEGLRKWCFFHFKRVPAIAPTLSIDHAGGLAHALRKRWGVGVVPGHLARELSRTAGCVEIRGPRGPFVGKLGLVQLRGRVPNLPERKWLAAVREALRETR